MNKNMDTSLIKKYLLSSDITLPTKVKIHSIEGWKASDDFRELSEKCTSLWDVNEYFSNEAYVYISCQLYTEGVPVGIPVYTTFGCLPKSNKFDQWLTFSVNYRDLLPSSQIIFTVWKNNKTKPIGGTSLSLFNSIGALRFGYQKCFLWPGVVGDGSVRSTTPHKVSQKAYTLEENLRRIEKKELPTVPQWADKLTYRKIEEMIRLQSKTEKGIYLEIALPSFTYNVIFHQKPCNSKLPEIQSKNEKRRIFILNDPEMDKDNPIEEKYYKISLKNMAYVAQYIKPTKAERRHLTDIIDSPNKYINTKQRVLVWRFRYSLIENPRALTKFLRSVDWNDQDTIKEAMTLIEQWETIETADALDLLTGVFTHEGVRDYAVTQLDKTTDEEITYYLLQIVQALRYERNDPSTLSNFLIKRGLRNFEIANYLNWYLTVETEVDKQQGYRFSKISKEFMDRLREAKPEWHDSLLKQKELVVHLHQLLSDVRKYKKVNKQLEKLHSSLSKDGSYSFLRDFKQSVPMPVRPDMKVCGIIGEECTMFKSALVPCCITFKTDTKQKYKVIFKSGDDLRQDQLVINIINLMDKLLKKVNLNLKLTPYRVLATSANAGFVEFVPHSHSMAKILESYENDLRKFFSHYHSNPTDFIPTIDTFVKSCAGYCVITYILGIGDRHLDNLLLTEFGHLFHIDFGYILGQDPKPFPPPMKLCKEMVEAMGGSDSKLYHEFEVYCCQVFNILRKSSNLILNLFNLMADSGITDLQGDVDKNLLKVQEKFRLDLNDEEAEQFFLSLIKESVSALFPQVWEKIHKWALYWP